MKVQMFHFFQARVKGPMGVYQEQRMRPAGGGSIVHDGKEYKPDAHGWIELPLDAFNALRAMQYPHPGGGYTKLCTMADVDEPERLGLVDEPEPEPVKKAVAKRA